jgi:hypothetical protein
MKNSWKISPRTLGLSSLLILTIVLFSGCQRPKYGWISGISPAFAPIKTVQAICEKGTPCFGIQGKVRVFVTVDGDGVPTAVKAISGDPRLYDVVVRAAYRYRFAPIADNRPKGVLRHAEFDVNI